MNKVFLSGNSGKDAIVRESQDKKIARYSLAVRNGFSKDGKTDWFNIVCFGKAAEFAEKYVKKGTKLIISGRLSTNTYTNKDGQTVNSVEVIADEQEFAESKKAAEQAEPTTEPANDGFMNADIDEELPFS